MKQCGIQTVVRNIAFCLAALAALHAAPVTASTPTPSTLSSRQLKENPQLLNDASFLMRQFAGFEIRNQTITRTDFEKVTLVKPSLRDVTFVDCTFTNSLFAGGEFNNVTFKNCRFDESQFRNNTFDKVSFVGGSIEMLHVTSEDREYAREMFEQHAFFDTQNTSTILLDGVKLREANLFSLEGGSLILKNMKDFTYHPDYGRMLSGKNIIVRIEQCAIAGVNEIASLDGVSGIYITDSAIRGGDVKGALRKDDHTNFYAERSQLTHRFDVERFENIVVRDCDFGGRVEAGNVFFVNTRFIPWTDGEYPKFPWVSGKKVSIQGGDAFTGTLYTHSDDELHVSNMRLETLSVSGKINALDLYNLQLDNLHFDSGLELKGGKWKNVEVRSPMKAASPGMYSFGSIDIHNTTLQGGNSIIDARTGNNKYDGEKYTLEMKVSETPVKPQNRSVPTLEELGMRQ